MRTIKVELRAQIDFTSTVVISTEVIIPDDKEVREAGADARLALDEFMEGYAG